LSVLSTAQYAQLTNEEASALEKGCLFPSFIDGIFPDHERRKFHKCVQDLLLTFNLPVEQIEYIFAQIMREHGMKKSGK
jgi:hypothetical protein